MNRRSSVRVHFRAGARIPPKADPHAVADELGRIYTQRGELHADDVVQAAADPRNPLHAAFPQSIWNDKRAAALYRLAYARKLIGAVLITVTRPDGQMVPARQFIHIDIQRQEPQATQTYIPIRRVLSDEALRQGQILRALDEFARLASRWAFVPELDGIATAIARTRKRIERGH